MEANEKHKLFLHMMERIGYSIIPTPNEEMIVLTYEGSTIPIPIEKLGMIEKDIYSYLAFSIHELWNKYNE